MFRKFFIVLLCSVFFISCTDKQTKKEISVHQSAALVNGYVQNQVKKQNLAVKKFVQKLTPQQKLSQIFIENLEGCTTFRSYETMGAINNSDDKTPLVAGGYLFFSYNIAPTREQQKAFMQSITDYCHQYDLIPPFLAVDQEGGWVNRLRKLNSPLPSQEVVAMENNITDAMAIYSTQSVEMKDLGFHMNLAPVMEICTDDNKSFLDGRSFGDAEKTLTYGRACINGYQNNGTGTVIKHFPGNTNTDPHTGLPEIMLSKDDLMSSISPFADVISLEPAGILMSHARTAAIDSEVPACLSKVWVTDILRNSFGYTGIIFSDDIFMGALADNGYPPEKAVVMAVEAGIDCIMISEKRFAKAAAMLYQKMENDTEFTQKIDRAVERIIRYKIKNGLLQLHTDNAGGYEVTL